MKMRVSMLLLFVGSVVLSMGACKKSRPTTAFAAGTDWTMYGRTSDEQRVSPLGQINEQNIGQLGMLWDRELGTTRGLPDTPPQLWR
jgi:glucose dehydrogenase